MSKPEDLTLAACFEAFAVQAIPEGAPPAQRQAMYMAFLSGATTVLQFYESLQQHRPTNVASGMARWGQNVGAELQRICSGGNG